MANTQDDELQYYVYVLLSLRDKKHYVGMTCHLEQRVDEHNAGKVTSTKSRRPLVLIYHEICSTRTEARRRELYLKSGAGRRWLRKHIK